MKKPLIVMAIITFATFILSLVIANSSAKRDSNVTKASCGKYQMEPGPGGWLVMPHGDGNAGIEKLRFASICRRKGLQPIQVTDDERLLVCKQGNAGLNYLFTHNSLLGTTVQGMVVERGVDVTCKESNRLYDIAESVQFNYAK